MGLTQSQMGELSGVTKKTQMLYESGDRAPKADYLGAAAQAGMDVQYVLTGNRMVSGTNGSPAAYRVEDGALLAAAAGPGPGMAAVALYDVEGAAGDGRSLEGERIEGELYFPEAQLAALGVSPGQVAGVKVRGDSMEGTLDDGDWVLVDLANRDPRRSGVFLLCKAASGASSGCSGCLAGRCS
jgi:transcriptional regulator with XRE-family HTH domain